jgi:hypothetical protein
MRETVLSAFCWNDEEEAAASLAALFPGGLPWEAAAPAPAPAASVVPAPYVFGRPNPDGGSSAIGGLPPWPGQSPRSSPFALPYTSLPDAAAPPAPLAERKPAAAAAGAPPAAAPAGAPPAGAAAAGAPRAAAAAAGEPAPAARRRGRKPVAGLVVSREYQAVRDYRERRRNMVGGARVPDDGARAAP